MTKNRGQGGLVRVGDIPQLKQLQKRLEKELKPPSRAQLDLIDAALAIQSEPDAAERAFLARQLILCTLPHSDPGSVEGWTRRTGSLALGIQPGFEYDTGKSIGYPFGTIPRLLLYWIGAEIQKDKNRDDLTLIEKRTLHLGRNLAAFMRAVGLNPRGGGKRGDAKRLHNQADRLFSSRIGWVEKPSKGAPTVFLELASNFLRTMSFGGMYAVQSKACFGKVRSYLAKFSTVRLRRLLYPSICEHSGL